jgi:hypothetical protein
MDMCKGLEALLEMGGDALGVGNPSLIRQFSAANR